MSREGRRAAAARGAESRPHVVEVETRWGRFAVAATPRGVCAVARVPAEGGSPERNRALRRALVRSGFDPAGVVYHAVGTRLPRALARGAAGLRRYAAGERDAFRGPFDARGTAFQRAVWRRLLAIPFGATTSYGRIARSLGAPRAARAVGAAVGANPVGVLIPCHRVVGTRGELTGYAEGLAMKRALLAHEGWGVEGGGGSERSRRISRRRSDSDPLPGRSDRPRRAPLFPR